MTYDDIHNKTGSYSIYSTLNEFRYILLESELENSSKKSGRQNYEKLILMQIAVLSEFLRSVT